MPVTNSIANAVRLTEFNPGVATTDFALDYPLYPAVDLTDLKSDFLVVKDGTTVTNFTVTATFVEGVALDGKIIFSPGISGNLKVYSRRRPRTDYDFENGESFTAEELQSTLNGIMASLRDTYDWLTRLEAGNVLPAGTFVPTAGGTMSGFLTLNADPTAVLHAASKQYVDGKLPLTTKGDLITRDSSVPVRLPVGSNNQRLVADSSQSSGLAWRFRGAPETTLTDAATIAWDLSTGENFKVTLGGNRTLGAFTNGFDGQEGYLRVIEDGTGNRTLNLNNAVYDFSNAQTLRPSPGANESTVYHFRRISSASMLLTRMWSEGFGEVRFWKEYNLGAFNDSATNAQAHGLGRYPSLVQAWIQCTSADSGYSVGDRVLLGGLAQTEISSGGGGNVWASTTDVGFVAAAVMRAFDKGSFSTVNIVEANWDMILRVYE